MAVRHVVVFPYPLPGHYIPVATFSETLAGCGAGIRVTVVHTEANLQKLPHGQRQGGANLQIVAISDGLPLHFDRKADYSTFMFTIQQMAPALQRLLHELHAAYPISCLVSDPNFPWVLDVANHLSLPLFLFLTDSAATFSVSMHACRLLSDGFIGKDSPKDASLLVDFIPGIPAFPAIALPFPGPELEFFFQLRLSMYDRVGEAAGVLLNTFYELERGAVDGASEHLSKPVLAVGPCVSDFTVADDEKIEGERDEVLQWLDKHAPASVMYVCFGSFVVPKEEQIREIWEGLRGSGQPFLWATQSVLAKELADTMRSEGGAGELAGLVVEWVPQKQVLCHPSVGGFMTHCGWNSVLESMTAGVPMLCCPKFLDQPLTCIFIVQVWRVGIQLVDAGELVERGALARLVRLMLLEEEGKHLRRRVAELREAARASLLQGSPPGSSIQSLHSFIKLLKDTSIPTST